jgi:predicted nucleotidyltransferase
MRNAAHLQAIQAVLAAFGEHAEHFVFVGGCVLGLYARPEGGPLRVTDDVDCISALVPWSLQAKILADLCQDGVLVPDEALLCRYRISGAAVVVDVLSPEGFNVGGVNPWFARATERARQYSIGEGRLIRAVTPPYFLATKLVAFENRGPDAQSSKDAEDIVALAVEVPTLLEEVRAEQMIDDVARLWRRVLDKYGLSTSDIPDLVAWHLHRKDHAQEARVIEVITSLVADRSPGS